MRTQDFPASDTAAMHAMHLRGKMFDAYRKMLILTDDERKVVADALRAGPEKIEKHLRRYEVELRRGLNGGKP